MTKVFRPDFGFRPAALPVPLDMPDQRLDLPFHDASAPAHGPTRHHSPAVRLAVLLLPPPVAAVFGWATYEMLGADGALTPADIALAILSGFAIYWMALSVVSSFCGMFWRPAPRANAAFPGLRVAILLPMYGENPEETIAPAFAMLDSLRGPGHAHRFSMHVISDTRSAKAAMDEAAMIARLNTERPDLELTYRHRTKNTDYKQGNVRDWITRQGGAYDAMLVLDADSRMGRATILGMADALVADPGCALVQSLPQTLPGESIWQRCQCFASKVYGGPHGRGFAMWTGSEGNFLGHNALIRVRAFATSAGLPHLSGPRPLGGVILSHDFVEAALLRRAGWGVRILPEAADSHEDAPASLLAHIKRDARWCQGNLQHLRLLAVPGLNWVSRLHFLSGAMAYLGSVLLAVILYLWLTVDPPRVRLSWYGSSWEGAGLFLAATVGFLLFAPRIFGVIDYIRREGIPEGQRLKFVQMLGLETVIAILTAPVMMVHHVKIILNALTGSDTGWPRHQSGQIPWGALARFHALETGLGIALVSMVAMGWISAWVLPLAIGLCLAVPISGLAGRDGSRLPVFGAKA